MRSIDQETWDAFASGVTPLGQPEPYHFVAPRYEQAIPRRQIDLHGLCLADAYTATMNLLSALTDRSATIVTGLSGSIKKEFPRWFDHLPNLRIEETHGGGAYELRVRRKR